MYWAQALAAQDEDAGLQEEFLALAETLVENETKIVDEMNAVQGQPMDIGGYYQPDDDLANTAMRPSATFNAAVASLGAD